MNVSYSRRNFPKMYANAEYPSQMGRVLRRELPAGEMPKG
jgi:hypothetical protein